ncbi:tRNA lysidine(34) synthetase TilS [Clostridium paraputrificum]|uniref:tRNA lysidine(34) synthetase TilS n=1 Tax=Clostridium TaxID=1485 RepID=UPI003D355868
MIRDDREKFIKFIEENNLIEKGEGILVGLSGGPDSVCLLHMLCSVKEELNLNIAAVHINHMLRGEEANKDEEYAKELCNKLGVEFYCKRIDINSYGKEKGLSSETAGREVRYGFFDEVMKNLSFDKVATAHNANDQAETILMRIMRGTGLEGLGGIPVKRDNKYIRPILFMERGEIEDYCEELGLKPRIDATNMERLYSRNKVRLDILPYMKNNFNPDVIESINRMASLLQIDNDFIKEEVEKYYKKGCYKKDNSIIIKGEVFNLNSAILNRILRKAISEVSGSNYDVEMKHIEDVCSLIERGTNKRVDLPNKVYAKNIYGDIHIKVKEISKKDLNEELVLSKEEILHKEILFDDYLLSFERVINDNNFKFSGNSLIKYFNYDKINGNIIIRYRKNGDKIVPLGMKGSKKLKDIFIDMKIPQEDRGSIPIIQFDEEIAWVVGVKTSDKYRVTKETKSILKIMLKRKEF